MRPSSLIHDNIRTCMAQRARPRPRVLEEERLLNASDEVGARKRTRTPTIIVDGTSAISSKRPHFEIRCPSPAKMIAWGSFGGTYTVTCRPPSYSNVSVTNSPATAPVGSAVLSDSLGLRL